MCDVNAQGRKRTIQLIERLLEKASCLDPELREELFKRLISDYMPAADCEAA